MFSNSKELLVKAAIKQEEIGPKLGKSASTVSRQLDAYDKGDYPKVDPDLLKFLDAAVRLDAPEEIRELFDDWQPTYLSPRIDHYMPNQQWEQLIKDIQSQMNTLNIRVPRFLDINSPHADYVNLDYLRSGDVAGSDKVSDANITQDRRKMRETQFILDARRDLNHWLQDQILADKGNFCALYSKDVESMYVPFTPEPYEPCKRTTLRRTKALLHLLYMAALNPAIASSSLNSVSGLVGALEDAIEDVSFVIAGTEDSSSDDVFDQWSNDCNKARSRRKSDSQWYVVVYIFRTEDGDGGDVEYFVQCQKASSAIDAENEVSFCIPYEHRYCLKAFGPFRSNVDADELASFISMDLKFTFPTDDKFTDESVGAWCEDFTAKIQRYSGIHEGA